MLRFSLLKQTMLGLAMAGVVATVPAFASAADEGTGMPQMTMQQRAEHFRQHHEMMMREFNKLGLSAAQWEQIKSLDSDFRSRLGNGAAPTRAELRGHEVAMMKVLTPDQRQTFINDMISLRQEMMKRWMAQHPGQNMPEHHEMQNQGAQPAGAGER